MLWRKPIPGLVIGFALNVFSKLDSEYSDDIYLDKD